MKKILFSAAMLLGMSLSIQAQDDDMIFNHLGAGFEVGTTGIGFEFSTTCTPYVQFRAGGVFMPTFKVKDVNVGLGDDIQNEWNKAQSNAGIYNQAQDLLNKIEDPTAFTIAPTVGAEQKQLVKDIQNIKTMPNSVNMDGEILGQSQFKFLVDVFPFKSTTFHATVGFYCGNGTIANFYTTDCKNELSMATRYNQYLANQKYTITNNYTGAQEVIAFGDKLEGKIGDNGTVIRPNGEVMTGYCKVNSFRPYLGIGFGRAVPQKTRLAFACDLGVQFWGTPKLYISQTDDNGVAYDKEIQPEDLGSGLKTLGKLTVYPCLNFRLTGRIF